MIVLIRPGYWMGRPYWRNGYCTEAGLAVLEYGFAVLNLNRIHAHHFKRNPASGRVLEKLGNTARMDSPGSMLKSGTSSRILSFKAS